MNTADKALERIARLKEHQVAVVAAWVAGRKLNDIAIEQGVSKQRIHQIVEGCRPVLAPFRRLPDRPTRRCKVCSGTYEWTMYDLHAKKPEHHFWSRVERSDGCWEWVGHRGKFGYGFTRLGGKTAYAHRTSWLLHVGSIPQGMHVLHRCDNPPCVRPDHLFLGTPRDNALDRDRKGRTGTHNGRYVCRTTDVTDG